MTAVAKKEKNIDEVARSMAQNYGAPQWEAMTELERNNWRRSARGILPIIQKHLIEDMIDTLEIDTGLGGLDSEWLRLFALSKFVYINGK